MAQLIEDYALIGDTQTASVTRGKIAKRRSRQSEKEDAA